MKASEWLATLPPGPGEEREAAIVHAVEQGWHITPTWVPIRSEARGRTATIYVMDRALRIGEPGDAVTVCMSATTAQRVSDLLQASLPTSHIMDLAWEQATVRLEPILRPGGLPPGDPHMSDTSVMSTYSAELDATIAGRTGLVRNCGKGWVLYNALAGKPDTACNYGWFSQRAPYTSWSGMRLWQQRGTRHNRFHSDFSQVYEGVLGRVLVDGENRALTDIMVDPNLAWLVSDEGSMKLTRMIGVSVAA